MNIELIQEYTGIRGALGYTPEGGEEYVGTIIYNKLRAPVELPDIIPLLEELYNVQTNQ